MTRELALLGLVALAFGAGSYQVLGELNAFNVANLALGGAALLAAGVGGARRFRRARHPADRGPMVEALLTAVALTWGAILVQVLVVQSNVHFDWTFERRYELSPATHAALADLSQTLELTLYYAAGDPRRRATRLLLEQMAQAGDAVALERDLDASPEDEDRYGIGSSNSVVLRLGDRWELVERPTEGTLFEAISRLLGRRERIVYATAGAGEGDLSRSDDLGYSGFRAALETEGYEVRPLPTALIDRVPEDADAVLVLAPERRLRPAAIEALRNYLEEQGGSLVAFLDPCRESGLEQLLADFGMASPEGLVIDPASGPVEGDAAGRNPIAFNYAEHPVTRGLNGNRMTFFRGARTFGLRKPTPEDRLQAVVYASGSSWVHADACGLPQHAALAKPASLRTDYHPLVVVGSYPRANTQARIVAFGDVGFASNRYLRALYNLDLAVNAVHWATDREPAITLRPKSGQLLQFPVPIQRSLNALYGVGLLIPEVLVAIGGIIWLRRRFG